MVCLIRILQLFDRTRAEGGNRATHLFLGKKSHYPFVILSAYESSTLQRYKKYFKLPNVWRFFYYLHELYDSNIHLVDLESTALPIKLSSHICGKVRTPTPCIAARLVFKTIFIADELPFLIIWVLTLVVGIVGFEPTCNQLSFQLLIRERLYIPIFFYPHNGNHVLVRCNCALKLKYCCRFPFLLREVDLHHWSYRSNTLFTIEPICLRRIATFLLSYLSKRWRLSDSNLWPLACKASALANWAKPP